MLLAAEPSFEFIRFLQVLGWIVIPVALIASVITIIVHRRRRRTLIGDDNEASVLLQTSPEQLGYTRGDGEYVFFDHSSLIRQYKSRLSLNQARYSALKHDFDQLRSRYESLVAGPSTTSLTSNNSSMEQHQEQQPVQLQENLAMALANHKIEKEEMAAEMKKLRASVDQLGEENRSLREQLQLGQGSDDDKLAMLQKWRDQHFSMREKLAEQQYLQEVVEEKKAQIEFLQQQLEARIRTSHQSELEKDKTVAALEEEKSRHVQSSHELSALKQELLQQKDEADRLQTSICGKEEQLLEQQQQLSIKADQIAWLENVLQETKQHQQLTQAMSDDDKNLIADLRHQQAAAQSRLEYLEQKLQANKQMMQRLYKELSGFIGEEAGQPPVVSMRPGYLLDGDDAAVQ